MSGFNGKRDVFWMHWVLGLLFDNESYSFRLIADLSAQRARVTSSTCVFSSITPFLTSSSGLVVVTSSLNSHRKVSLCVTESFKDRGSGLGALCNELICSFDRDVVSSRGSCVKAQHCVGLEGVRNKGRGLRTCAHIFRRL